MESLQKQGVSDSSSDENEAKELDTAASTTTRKRSYECTFCKRGFTNAQALGGHMNIHRKDRAKTKQTTKPVRTSEEEYMNPRNIAAISNDPLRYYSIFDSHQRSFFMRHHQPSASGPRYPLRDFIVHQGPQSLSKNNQELLGSNLSLGVGPTTFLEDNNEVMRNGTLEEAGLDLELRLGRNR